MHQVDMYETMFTVGGLPEGITALRRLQHLRLGDCITEPLACDLSQFTQLTSLEIPTKDVHDHNIYDPDPVTVRCLPSKPVAATPTNAGRNATLSSYLTRVSHLIGQIQPVLSSPAQALPSSLRVLEAFLVPAESLVRLTALERLSLDSMMRSAGQPTRSLSALQRLTPLHLNYAADQHLLAFAGCTGMRALYLTSASCSS